jgi:hypothetical protein
MPLMQHSPRFCPISDKKEVRAMAKYANQKTILKEENDFRNHPYVKLNIEDIQEAMKHLSGYDFELYIYLYMN